MFDDWAQAVQAEEVQRMQLKPNNDSQLVQEEEVEEWAIQRWSGHRWHVLALSAEHVRQECPLKICPRVQVEDELRVQVVLEK